MPPRPLVCSGIQPELGLGDDIHRGVAGESRQPPRRKAQGFIPRRRPVNPIRPIGIAGRAALGGGRMDAGDAETLSVPYRPGHCGRGGVETRIPIAVGVGNYDTARCT